MLIERIFIARHLHPRKKKGTAAGNNVHLPAFAQEDFHGPTVDTRMDGHEIHAFFRMQAYYFQKILSRDLLQIFFQITDSIVNWDGTDDRGGGFEQFFAKLPRLAVIAQIHNCFRAELLC